MESDPDNVRTSDLSITPLSGTAWTIEAFPDTLLKGLSIAAGERDVYRASLAARTVALLPTAPLPLFSLALPDGCNDGAIAVLANDSVVTADLFTTTGVALDNAMPAEVAPEATMADLYAGVDESAGSLACEATPLAVTLAYFLAEADDDQVEFVWQTATETGSAGFNLLANEDGRLTLLNSNLIPSKVMDSATPTDYAYAAVTSADAFYIEEIGVDGSMRRNGPFMLGAAFDAYSKPHAVPERVIYLPAVRR